MGKTYKAARTAKHDCTDRLRSYLAAIIFLPNASIQKHFNKGRRFQRHFNFQIETAAFAE